MLASVEQSVTACVMCSAPLAPHRLAGGVLCGSQQCAARHAALLPMFKCSQCTRPLTTTQRATGYCDSTRCRDAVMRERREATLGLERDLFVRLVQQREESAPSHDIPAGEAASYRLALLPFNDDAVTPFPPERRELHEAHLRAMLALAREQREQAVDDAIAGAPELTNAPATPTRRAESQLLHLACATCRGACCRQGGNDAFLTETSMLAYLQQHPTHTDDEIVTRYVAHIGPHTMTHGCVYQGERGCTLAPALRAEICHSFYCTGLRMLKDRFEEGEAVRAYLVTRAGGYLVGEQFVQVATRDEHAPGVA